jgi:chromosome segregation protein
VRLENIETTMMQKYSIDVRSEEITVEGFDPEEDEKKITALNETIQAMGPVNIGAIEEYEELKTRYDFLSKQQQDLTLSIAELEEAITRINATTRKKLREAYDALRGKFQEVFTVLFGGGRADIVLTEEENILESGLDIIAQPPGKKLQNINLLSGGEKALTSLSLLFAGFLIKPSPLCILDEADAPLDESNTVRFARMIKDLAVDTQFLVITHNRATMEAADYLYGITMEDPGVSKAISLRFSEAENSPVT